MTQILSPNSLKPRSEHLLCSVRTRLRLANAFNERGLQDLTMYPMRSLQGNAHAIQNQRIFPPSISQNGIFFCLPGYDQSFEKKHQFHKSYTHTLAHNAQERHDGDLGRWISSMLAWLFWVPFPVMTQFFLLFLSPSYFTTFPDITPLFRPGIQRHEMVL